MNIKNILLIICVLVAVVSLPNYGQKKLAQSGMKFLLVSTDAKTAAMGDAVTALEGNSSSMFSNPASMARLNTIADVSINHVKWIADIEYYSFAAAFAPYGGLYGVGGISFEYVNYGDFFATIRAPQNDYGYIDIGKFSPKALAVGISYAKALSEKFSVGGNIRYAYQELGPSILAINYTAPSYTKKEYVPNVFAFDFGMLYHTGIQSLDFGVSVKNFSREIKLELEGYQIPLIFQMGFAYNLSDALKLDKNEHSIQMTIDANHPRDFSEQVMIGVDYTFMKMFSLRCGYSTPNDEHGFTAGLGINQSVNTMNFSLDYCYTPWTTFSDVHKFSLHFSL